MPSAATEALTSSVAYRRRGEDVIAELGTDVRRGLTDAEARTTRAVRPQRAGGREAGPGVATVPRAVPGCARHPAARRHRDLGGAVGSTSATRRCPTRRSRSSRSCCSTPSWATSRSRGPRRPWRRCAQMSAARRHRDPRRRAAERRRRRARARRHHPDRGRRHDSGRRPADRVDRAADRRSGADRREPAGREGHRRRSPTRCRSATAHNMVFSGTAATYGHGTAVVTATGMQTEMGRIAGLLQETRRRADAAAAASSIAPASCSASSWSSSPS